MMTRGRGARGRRKRRGRGWTGRKRRRRPLQQPPRQQTLYLQPKGCPNPTPARPPPKKRHVCCSSSTKHRGKDEWDYYLNDHLQAPSTIVFVSDTNPVATSGCCNWFGRGIAEVKVKNLKRSICLLDYHPQHEATAAVAVNHHDTCAYYRYVTTMILLHLNNGCTTTKAGVCKIFPCCPQMSQDLWDIIWRTTLLPYGVIIV